MTLPCLISSRVTWFEKMAHLSIANTCVGVNCPSYVASSGGQTFMAGVQFFAAAQCLVTENWPPPPKIDDGMWYTFIVVGGGSAGAALAGRLAEVDNWNILLVEAGGDPPIESVVPDFRGKLINTAYDWNFTSINDGYSSQALDDGGQKFPRGKMVGGTGAINNMVYARGFPEDYADWEQAGGVGWAWDNVLEYFKKSEILQDERIENDPNLSKYHGFDGPMSISGDIQTNSVTEFFISAFKEGGFEEVIDMTNPENKFGVGRFIHSINKGQRETSATAFLKTRPNLHVLRNAYVSKILINDTSKTAYGVMVKLQSGKTIRLYAFEEIVCSAGTIGSPRLLLLSGIGPKEHLDSLRIPVFADLPVGQNLQDHVMYPMYIQAQPGTCSSPSESEQHFESMRYLYDRSGTLGKQYGMAGYFSLHGGKVPDFAIYPTCIPRGTEAFFRGCKEALGLRDSICRQYAKVNVDHDLISLAVVMLKPSSRGSVYLKSSDPEVDPLIFSGSFGNVSDIKPFALAVKRALSLLDTKQMREVNATVIQVRLPGCEDMEYGSDEYWSCAVVASACSAYHPVGTCALGTVLDEELRVRGVRHLRVVDASVMPTIIRGNTNAPAVMIAEKAADLIKR